MSRWSKALPGDRSLDAKYKQLQRFVRFFRFSPKLYARLIWQLYGQEQTVYLTLDRTDRIAERWKMRGQWVQVIMIGIAHQGMSIPLLWQTLNGQGNTPKVVRQALLCCFQRWITPEAHQQLWWVADRDGVARRYIGKEWFEEITQQNMHFCIRSGETRLRKNAVVLTGNKRVKLFQLFETRSLRIPYKSRRVHGCKLYLAGQRLENGDFFIVGSATKTRALAQIYAKRWQVETLFACFKSRGFNIENCRVNHCQRIKTGPRWH